MRITVSHTKTKEEVIRNVDRSFDDLLKGVPGFPLQIVNEHRSWQGSTLTFAVRAKMGFLSSPIKGRVEVTDKDITIDADLGVFEKLLSGGAKASLESRVRGLLT